MKKYLATNCLKPNRLHDVHKCLLLLYFLCASYSQPLVASRLVTGGLTNLSLMAIATASSNANSRGSKYYVDDLKDGSLETWWASGNNAPMPQWVRLTLSQSAVVDTLVIIGVDTPTLYANWKQIEVAFSDGSKVDVELEDKPFAQLIRFPSRTVEWLQVNILSTHGQKIYVGCAELMVFNDPQKKVSIKLSSEETWRHLKLTREQVARHPTVYMTPEDVSAAKQRAERYAWAKSTRDEIILLADQWISKPDDWFLKVLPAPGAAFAYGFTGCPICGASWGSWGGANATWDNPGHVRCGNGHVLPDADHPDPGTGYVGKDGRIHYFTGSYNAWVVEKLESDAAENLALAYTLTGDDRYAAKCAVILDGFANIYPSCDKGSWDYPSTPPSGRFDRPWYQVARVLVHYVDQYDQIYSSKSLDAPSARAGLTRRRNIEENLLLNGARYCYDQSLHGGLHNGEADYIRGCLAVGVCLGIPEYLRWSTTGPFGILSMLENNVDRNGHYFEISQMYSDHTRGLYLTFSEPLYNYRGSVYPNGLNLYDHPKFQRFFLFPNLVLLCAAHVPRYGDDAPDTSHVVPPPQPYSHRDNDLLEYLTARVSDGDKRKEIEALLTWTSPEVDHARASSPEKRWLLFHAKEVTARAPNTATTSAPGLDTWERRLMGCDFVGQKGFGILRAGKGSEAQAALLRFGPSLNHGHEDDLNLNYFTAGYEVTYDLGYGLGSTHTQVGWSHQTASHNLVVVDEKSQGGKSGSGGSLHLFLDHPACKVVEASAEPSYAEQGVTTYRRTVALLGEGADRYLVDVFRVAGGRQHDYMFHSLADNAKVEGVQLGEEERGSLAGPDVSWGDKQQNDGDMTGYPNKPYWSPPPGNGYGFLIKPQRGRTDGAWSAEWSLKDSGDTRVRLFMAPQADSEVITAVAPGIYPNLPKARYVLARRKGENLSSAFASVMSAYSPPKFGQEWNAPDIAKVARADRGEVRLIDAYPLLLFKGTTAGDTMTFARHVEREDDYTLAVRPFNSPNYGTAQILLDGNAIGPVLQGHSAVVRPASEVVLGVFHLKTGDHLFGLRMISSSTGDEANGGGGNFWMGIQELVFKTREDLEHEKQAKPAFPVISIDRLAGTSSSPNAQPVGLKIALRNGQTDYVFSSLDPDTPISFGEVLFTGAFARARVDANGHLLLLDMTRAKHFVGFGEKIERPAAELTGEVREVDPDKGIVFTNVKLPTDGSLTGRMIAFSNPNYSRNTCYHILRVDQVGDRTRIAVEEQTFLLGRGQLDEDPPDDTTLTSLIPHEYFRAVNRTGDSWFFKGKLIRTQAGASTHVINGTPGTVPLTLKVESSKGFAAGDWFAYCDVQPGDQFGIACDFTWKRP